MLYSSLTVQNYNNYSEEPYSLGIFPYPIRENPLRMPRFYCYFAS